MQNVIECADARGLNRSVGVILKKQRQRTSKSISDAANAVSISGLELTAYEKGAASIPACLFYQLIEHYGGSWFEVESQLFEAIEVFRSRIARKNQ